MDYLNLKKYQSYLIVGLVALFSLFALWLRLLPMFNMGNTDILTMVASDDPLYNLRQVEQMLSNNLAYAWFDPMTLFPSGSNIYWGPIFPMIIALCCIITGATTRPEIIGIALLVPPLMGTVMVMVMYYAGKTCGDWKTGLLASGFTAVVSGQFFYRSFYGYIDHHIAEVLFSTIFCLFYMYALLSEKDQKTDLKDFNTYKKTLLFSCLAGIAYVLGLFVMPTIILFAMIAGIFTIIQFVIDVYRGRTSEYILLINGTIFIIAIFGMLVFGFKNAGIDLSAYTIGHIYAYIGMIAGTGLLYLIQIYLKGKERILFPAAIAGCGILFALILYITSPQLYTLLVYDLFAFFGQAPVTNTVQEARGWSTEMAWITFNYGLLLMLGGILVMIYKNTRNEHPEQVFALVWSLIMLASTVQHVRYEYYLAINVALLSAVCVSFTFEQVKPDIRKLFGGIRSTSTTIEEESSEENKVTISKKQKKGQKKHSEVFPLNYVAIAIMVIIIGISILFIASSVIFSYSNASGSPNRMNSDWKESLEWMEQNTPDTGVGYNTIYTPKSFQYPQGSYGVMSWWDYGHMITYIAKRIPNANPFQQGVAGDLGAAAYFMSTTEDASNNIANHLGTRYIITDIEMDSGKFWAMSTWYNASVAAAPYQTTMLVPDDSSQNSYQPAQLNTQEYYLTTISRLHNFDGSMTEPSVVYYVEYVDPQVSHYSLPAMTNAVQMNATAAAQNAREYNMKAPAGHHAAVLNPSIIEPVETVPALQHYRLVHESPSNVFTSKTIDVKYVKTFEYVKGAHIKGDGIIEVTVISNTGRNFTYRQKSIDSEFIVPYSTTGNPYDVKTTGKYRIVGTDRQFDVPESAVIQGTTIQ
jgi:dolichyl-phosphooligosaccharide-protein glycotransferase